MENLEALTTKGFEENTEWGFAPLVWRDLMLEDEGEEVEGMVNKGKIFYLGLGGLLLLCWCSCSGWQSWVRERIKSVFCYLSPPSHAHKWDSKSQKPQIKEMKNSKEKKIK